MSGTRHRLFLLGWLGFASALTGVLHADGLIRDGVGPISTGRGGTNIAHSDNAAVILDNPAGIVNFEQKHYAEFGIDTVITDLHYTDPQNNVNASTQPMPIPEFAYYRTSEDKCWGGGIGFFAPAGFCASYMMENPTFGPGDHRYRSKGMYAKILPGLACRVTDELSVGAAIGVGVCRVELDGPFNLQTGPLAGVPANFDMTTTGAALIWNIGLQYKLSDRTTIGLAYNSDASFDTKGDLDATVYGIAPVPVQSHFNTHLSITWPASLGLGIKHIICDQHRVSADVIYYNWHGAFDDLGVNLTGPSNPAFQPIVGTGLNDYVALNWTDTVSVRLGYEYFCTPCDTFRLGYVYHPSPVPSNTLNPYIDGVLLHAFTIGYSHRWGDWLFNMAYEYSFSPTRTVGDSILAGGDFDNSTFKAQAHWIGVSVARTW